MCGEGGVIVNSPPWEETREALAYQGTPYSLPPPHTLYILIQHLLFIIYYLLFIIHLLLIDYYVFFLIFKYFCNAKKNETEGTYGA